MIDTHCHLADEKFAKDLAAVLQRAEEAGVTDLVTIGDSLPESERCVEIAEKHAHVFCAVGVHPHNAKQWRAGDGERLAEMARGSTKVRAIGEIGLDYHYDHSPRSAQRGVFLEQLTLSKELKLPAVVHCRDAIGDVLAIIREVEPLQVVLHCCTEAWEDVEPLLSLGHMLSFTGIATYPSSHVVHATIKKTPLAQLMLETDSPYLAPVPHRGKRNEPQFVREVAAAVARIKGVSIEETDAQTTRNAVAFFGLRL